MRIHIAALSFLVALFVTTLARAQDSDITVDGNTSPAGIQYEPTEHHMAIGFADPVVDASSVRSSFLPSLDLHNRVLAKVLRGDPPAKIGWIELPSYMASASAAASGPSSVSCAWPYANFRIEFGGPGGQTVTGFSAIDTLKGSASPVTALEFGEMDFRMESTGRGQLVSFGGLYACARADAYKVFDKQPTSVALRAFILVFFDSITDWLEEVAGDYGVDRIVGWIRRALQWLTSITLQLRCEASMTVHGNIGGNSLSCETTAIGIEKADAGGKTTVNDYREGPSTGQAQMVVDVNPIELRIGAESTSSAAGFGFHGSSIAAAGDLWGFVSFMAMLAGDGPEDEPEDYDPQVGSGDADPPEPPWDQLGDWSYRLTYFHDASWFDLINLPPGSPLEDLELRAALFSDILTQGIDEARAFAEDKKMEAARDRLKVMHDQLSGVVTQ